MMETFGIKATGSVARIAPSAPASPVRSTTTETAPPVAAPDPTALARTMAASPPVNTDRVSEIRAAIAKGTFPLLPSTIADQMIALKLAWNPNDKA